MIKFVVQLKFSIEYDVDEFGRHAIWVYNLATLELQFLHLPEKSHNFTLGQWFEDRLGS